jgi:hypothetical protein
MDTPRHGSGPRCGVGELVLPENENLGLRYARQGYSRKRSGPATLRPTNSTPQAWPETLVGAVPVP